MGEWAFTLEPFKLEAVSVDKELLHIFLGPTELISEVCIL